MTDNVIALPGNEAARVTLYDIPQALRRLADQIEQSDERPRFVVALRVWGQGRFIASAYGELSPLEAIGAMAWAAGKGLVDE